MQGTIKLDAGSGWVVSSRLDGKLSGKMSDGQMVLELAGRLQINKTMHR